MAFGFAGAAAGANREAKGQRDELAEMLARRRAAYIQQEQLKLAQEAGQRAAAGQQQQAEQFNRRFEQDQQEFGLRKTDSDFARQQAGVVADQRAEDRRAATNKAGVRQMAIEGLRLKTAQPRDAQLMAAAEGVEIEPDVLDPERRAREAAETDKRRHGFEMSQIAARGAQDRSTLAARPQPQSNAIADDGQALAVVEDALRTMSTMRGMGGKSGAIGAGIQKLIPFVDGPLPGTAAGDYKKYLDTLKAQLVLPRLGILKGVLSDSDIKMLTDSATALDANLSEGAYDPEFDNVERTLRAAQQKLAAKGGGAGAPAAPPQIQKWGRDAQGRPVRVQ